MPARNALLREVIPTNISQVVAPILVKDQQGNIIHLQKFRGESSENIENIEIKNFLRNLLQSANLSGAVMTDPTREEIKAEIAASEAHADTKIVRLEGKVEG